ncbi:YihY family inner membrane protein [Aestuariicoccus sp. MJ-SS9]|uniref:YihY family inner membrane protein n=1 Tax=Aestuariicoccus sp. MJ-SS9 TaxID=3079855 RepID=UPI002930A945|nr:YihY family inner membrane protein [Aestuariicoccus sp. MJ-SS9]
MDTQIDRLQRTRGAGIVAEVANFVIFAVRRFFADRLNNAAASLTYSTLLALVPLLVIAFAILSSFRAFDAVKDRMRQLFLDAVVPEAGAAITNYLSSFTENASNLTAVGVVALAVAAVLLLSTIEDTLNRIWHVERPRPILVRFLIFWAILTLGPMLIAASIALTSDVMHYARNSALFDLGVPAEVGRRGSWIIDNLVSVGINLIGFTALFVLVPARRVRVRDALIGAGFAAVSFELLSWGFNTFLTSGSSYETIYGAVAVVPVFLVWVYTSWMVIILGAVLAAAFPDWWQARSAELGVKVGPVERLELAVELLSRLHQRAQTGGTLDEETLMEATPFEARDDILDALNAAGYVVETENGRVALARDMHSTTLQDLARDLGMALGLAPGAEDALPEGMTDDYVADLTALRAALGRLHEAEGEILGTPIAELASAGTARRGASVEVLAQRSQT